MNIESDGASARRDSESIRAQGEGKIKRDGKRGQARNKQNCHNATLKNVYFSASPMRDVDYEGLYKGKETVAYRKSYWEGKKPPAKKKT